MQVGYTNSQKWSKSYSIYFIHRLFLKMGIADLNDIEIKATTRQRVLDISLIVSKKEINKLIKGLPNGKALRPDNIPNEVFKVIALVIAKDLAKATSHYFTNGIIPESLKKSIMVILRKKGKKYYSLLNSYRLVALENMLTKVLEKHVANIILKAAEKYGLFLWNQMGGRCK